MFMFGDQVDVRYPEPWCTDVCVPHFFIYKPGKARFIFNGKRLNKAAKVPPRFIMESHTTIKRLTSKYSLHASDDL